MRNQNREFEFKVWCEFEINGKIETRMEEACSWFMITQTGKLWSYGPTSRPHPLEKEYKKAIPLFYVGLKDKQGEKIFECDIVKHARAGNKAEEIGEVWISASQGVMVGNWPASFDLEILGNIFENPELLERP